MIMTMWFRAAALGALLVGACCGSPTGPDDPRAPAPVGTPSYLEITHCEYQSSRTICPAWASWGQLYVASRDVTATAEWVSTRPSVLRISSAGRLDRVASGDAEVRVSFSGKTASTMFRVFADGPPWKVQAFTARVNIRDQNNRPLEGVLVEITAGVMAGGTVITDQNGSATVWPEFICGPVSMRASKAGYRTWTRSFVNCGQDGNGRWGADNLDQPITMIPG